MYYICKFGETWSVMDTDDKSNQPLDPAEIALIKKRFSKLISDELIDFIGVQKGNPKDLLKSSKAMKKSTLRKESANSEKM